MGTEYCTYVMTAARFTFEEFEEALGEDWAERFETYHDNPYKEHVGSHNGLTMITDGMNGEYIFFGFVMAKADQYSGLEVVDVEECVGYKHEVEEAIYREFDRLGVKMLFRVGVYAFAYWH